MILYTPESYPLIRLYLRASKLISSCTNFLQYEHRTYTVCNQRYRQYDLINKMNFDRFNYTLLHLTERALSETLKITHNCPGYNIHIESIKRDT